MYHFHGICGRAPMMYQAFTPIMYHPFTPMMYQ